MGELGKPHRGVAISLEASHPLWRTQMLIRHPPCPLGASSLASILQRPIPQHKERPLMLPSNKVLQEVADGEGRAIRGDILEEVMPEISLRERI